jgi:hypothetical protein
MLVEPVATYFDPAFFGIAATYNGSATVNGILDLAYYEPLGNVAEGSAPVFTCAAADVPSVAHGDTLVIGARTYKVCGVEPDGTGIVLLRLERQ